MSLKSNILVRPGLLAHVERLSTATRLALVIAPAGYGKSTLLQSWRIKFDECEQHYQCLRLSKFDKDKVYFSARLSKALSNLLMAEDITPKSNLMEMLSQFYGMPKPSILLLDDYHFAETIDNNNLLSEILACEPRNLVLVIASRHRPAISIQKMKLEGSLMQIGPGQLRFSHQETSQFLAEKHNIQLSDQHIDGLLSKTEGWPASLQLASISLQNCDDCDAFIQNFSGSDRDIFDYLVDMVLANQSEELKEFLFVSAVPDEFCADLCSHLLRTNSVRQFIEELEDRNLFLIPLDRERGWYRYHHLFQDFLRKTLELQDPERLTQVLRMTSGWCEAYGRIDDAIEYALRAGLYTEAVELMEEAHYNCVMQNGHHDIFMSWVDRLPKNLLTQNVSLMLTQAYSLIFMRKTDAAFDLLKNIALRTPKAVGLPDVTGVEAAELMIKAITMDFQNDVEIGFKACEEWQRRTFDSEPAIEVSILCAISYKALFTNEFAAGERACEEAYNITAGESSDYGLSWCEAIRSLLFIYQGRYQEAYSVASQALEANRANLGEKHYTSLILQIVVGIADFYLGNIPACVHKLGSVIEFIQDYSPIMMLQSSVTLLARIAAYQGKIERARNWLDLGDRTARKWKIDRLGLELKVQRVLIELQFGDVELGRHLAEIYGFYKKVEGRPDGVMASMEHRARHFIAAHLALADQEYERAFEFFNKELLEARENGNHMQLLDAVGGCAIVLLRSDQRQAAIHQLQGLKDVINLPTSSMKIVFGYKELYPLLNQFIGYAKSDTAKKDQGLAANLKFFELTKRERDIALELCEQLTNKEISAKLRVPEEAVKRHLDNICQKLNVSCRQKAVQKLSTLVEPDVSETEEVD